MSVFLFKRLFTFLATLVVASVLVFAVLELLPGNVAQVMLGETATPESIAALETKLGLDKPPLQRYAHWVGGLLQGRTANSFSYDTPTAELIVERLQVTVPLGVLAAVAILYERRRRRFEPEPTEDHLFRCRKCRSCFRRGRACACCAAGATAMA